MLKEMYSTKETLAKTKLSKYRLSSYVKAGRLNPVRKGSYNYYDAVEIQRLIQDLPSKERSKKPSNFLKKNGIQKSTLSNLLLDTQTFLGGSTSNCNWTGTTLAGDVSKPMDMVWGTYPEYQDREYLEMEGTFCDTLIVAVPVEIDVISESGALRPRAKEVAAAQKLATRIIMPRDPISFGGVPLHGSVIFPVDPAKGGKISLSAIEAGYKINHQTKLDPDNWGVGEYKGYLLFRFSASAIPIRDMAHLVAQNSLVLRGDIEALGTKYNLPIFFPRLDITSNLPGAVKPYARDLEPAGLGLKDNKNYVGNTCHTYYPLRGSGDSRIKAGSKHAMAVDSKYTIDAGHPLAASIRNTMLKISTFAEREVNQADSTMLALAEVCNIELSQSSHPVEAKIYDKLRYMLSVGEVGRTFTGFNLSNLAYSPRPEIRNLFRDFKDVGSSRVETRYRLSSMLLGWRGLVELHIEFCQLLSSANSIKYPLQKSLDAFLSTVKACTLLRVKTDKHEEDIYLCSQWVDRQTGKIQGLEKGLTEHRANNWAANMSNRSVPLHVLTYNIDNTGCLKLEEVRTFPPLAVSKGLANANEVTGIFSTAKKVRHQFGLKLPFTISAINPVLNRLTTVCTISSSQNQARGVAAKMRYAYSQQLKRVVEQVVQERSTYQNLLERALKSRRSIRVNASLHLEGYLINKDNVLYFVTMLRHGRSVKYYKLHGSVRTPIDISIRYKMSVAVTISGKIHNFLPV